MAKNLLELPNDLPVPEDDGAAKHLPGMTVPDIALPATIGGSVVLAEQPERTVVYAPAGSGTVDEYELSSS